MTTELIDSNTRFLTQGIDLLQRVSPADYVRRGEFGLSPAGGHMRHVLDHYACFLTGLTSGTVDYDARTRAADVERHPVRAIEVANDIVAQMKEVRAIDADHILRVRMNCGTANIEPRGSTVGRELQFLVSHTVHHYALVRAVLAEAGLTIDATFGVAPSTLKQQSDAACAR